MVAFITAGCLVKIGGSLGRRRLQVCCSEPTSAVSREGDYVEENQDEREERENRQRADMAAYRRKVDERIRGGIGSAQGRGPETDSFAGLPDDLDIIDDMVMNRGPNDEGRVAMWGAWLDEDIAGRKAGGKGTKITRELEDAELRFKAGLALFNRGRYLEATKDFTAAALLVGINSRPGGQYQLWLAQAWDAGGQKTKAVTALQVLKGHKDSDVRKVAEELQYIITAPPLNLGDENFVQIDTKKDFEARKKRNSRRSSASSGPIPMTILEKGPEKYTLEWYLGKKEEKPVGDLTEKAAIGAIIILAVGMAIASRM